MLDAKKRSDALRNLASLWAKVSDAEVALAKAIKLAQDADDAFKRQDFSVQQNAKKE